MTKNKDKNANQTNLRLKKSGKKDVVVNKWRTKKEWN